MLIEPRSADDSELAALVVDQQIELRQRDGGLESPIASIDPAARHLVVVIEGHAVACGGLRALDVDAAEIKRLYVKPVNRGYGVARRLLAALEDLAVSRGHTVVRLETGVHQPEAIALFTSSGYRPIGHYGQYVRNEYSRCFEKTLAASASDADIRLLRRMGDHPDVVALVGDAVAELARRYGGADDDYPVDPRARFVVAMVDGQPAGCGAFHPLNDQTVELKRMYVRPDYRGRGLSRRILACLEDLAAGAHYTVVRLETGTRQPEAIGLYRSAGYEPIPLYGPYVNNPFSQCFEKGLFTAHATTG